MLSPGTPRQNVAGKPRGEIIMKQLFSGMRWIFTSVTVLLAVASVPANAGQRPLSDFTSQQGAWCAVISNGEFDCAASYYGGPECLQGGFSNYFPQEWGDPKTGLFASIDALGQFDDGDFGTIVDGSISEA